MHHAITATSAVAAPSDVAHLLREGSAGLMTSPAVMAERMRMDGRAELYLDMSAAPADSGGSPTAEPAVGVSGAGDVHC